MTDAVATSMPDYHGPVNPEGIPPAYGQVADGVHIFGGLGNAVTIDLGDGLLQIDTGPDRDQVTKLLAGVAQLGKPVKVIAFSHGHLGYNFGCPAWLQAAEAANQPRPLIVAQDRTVELIERYELTGDAMKLLLALQFDTGLPPQATPLPLTRPDSTFRDSREVSGTERTVTLFSAPSETPGAIGAWIPDVEVLYAGPSCIPLLPNLGMPLWPTGDDEQWALTLDHLAEYDAAHLIGQYGPVIHGKAEVREFLTTTAAALRFIRSSVIEHLNKGHNLNTTLTTFEYPEELFGQPMLGQNYSSHDDAVRRVWESIVGWWDRNPTSLQALPEGQVADAIRSAITDPESVLRRARELNDRGDSALALHVVDLLALAPGGDPIVEEARQLKSLICSALAENSQVFSVQALYRTAAAVIADPPPIETGIR